MTEGLAADARGIGSAAARSQVQQGRRAGDGERVCVETLSGDNPGLRHVLIHHVGCSLQVKIKVGLARCCCLRRGWAEVADKWEGKYDQVRS